MFKDRGWPENWHTTAWQGQPASEKYRVLQMYRTPGAFDNDSDDDAMAEDL